MNVRLSKEDIMNILAWAGTELIKADETKIPLDESEKRTLKKLHKSLEKK